MIKPEGPQQSSDHSVSATHFPHSCGYYLNLIILPLYLRSKQGSQQKNLVMDLVSAAKFKFAGKQKWSLPLFPFRKFTNCSCTTACFSLIGGLDSSCLRKSDIWSCDFYFPVYLRGISVVTHRPPPKNNGWCRKVVEVFSCLLMIKARLWFPSYTTLLNTVGTSAWEQRQSNGEGVCKPSSSVLSVLQGAGRQSLLWSA